MTPFNSDTFIKGELEQLIKKFTVKSIVETGTYKGDTTLEFSKMVNQVFTIEVNDNYYKDLLVKFKKLPIISIRGSSSEKLDKIIDGAFGSFEQPALFYLDAHWYHHNPLLDELRILAEKKMNTSVIAIHDFKVPGKDFGFDKFSDGSEYTYEFIEKHIEKIYGVGKFDYHYNEQANGAYRGIIFIYPKKVE